MFYYALFQSYNFQLNINILQNINKSLERIMKQTTLAVALTIASTVQSLTVWPKVNIPYNHIVRMDNYKWDTTQKIMIDLKEYRISKMSSELNFWYNEDSHYENGQESLSISTTNYNYGESLLYDDKEGCRKGSEVSQKGYVAMKIFGMYNPYLNFDGRQEFVGTESPEWDSGNTYYRLNEWSEDHQTLYRWLLYRTDTGDVAWEVQPDFQYDTDNLFLYKYGPGYLPTRFQPSDFDIQQCNKSSLFLN